jgi:hypothetical protein
MGSRRGEAIDVNATFRDKQQESLPAQAGRGIPRLVLLSQKVAGDVR